MGGRVVFCATDGSTRESNMAGNYLKILPLAVTKAILSYEVKLKRKI